MKNNIDYFRKKAGLTVQQLAELAGMSRIYLQELKAGKKRLNEDVLQRLAAALHCRIQDLVAEDVEKPTGFYEPSAFPVNREYRSEAEPKNGGYIQEELSVEELERLISSLQAQLKARQRR